MNSQIGNMLALRSYDSLVSRKTLWSVLVFLVVMAHLAGITGNHDDLSVLRASSYMSRFPNDPLLTQLEDHLENRALQLDPATYTRYYVRLKVVNSYVAQNWLVGVLESLPSYSAYQSVFLSNLILHLLAAIAVFLVFGRFWGTESNILMYSFLLSLIPASLFPVGRLMLLFPFQAEVVSWFIPVSRGAALLFFFASLLVWHNVGRPFTLSWGRRVGLALLLSTAAILSHQGTALLLYVPTLVVTGLYRFSGYDPLRLSAKVGVRSFLLLLNSLSIVVAGMKLTLLATLGGFENVASSGVNILLWAIEANLLTYYWLRMRLAAKGDSEDRLRLIGDTLARYLVPFSAFVLGFNLVQPSEALRWSNIGAYFTVEAGLRFLGICHLLWWMLFGLLTYERLKQKRWQILRAGELVILVLLCVGITIRSVVALRRCPDLFDNGLLTTRVSSLLARPGTEAYSDEVLYFQGIANELRSRDAR